jgi:hypothetical protein
VILNLRKHHAYALPSLTSRPKRMEPVECGKMNEVVRRLTVLVYSLIRQSSIHPVVYVHNETRRYTLYVI